MNKSYLFTAVAGILVGIICTEVKYHFKVQRVKQESYEEGTINSYKLLGEVAEKAAKDTNKVFCFDFAVPKDTIHIEVWNKNIKKINCK